MSTSGPWLVTDTKARIREAMLTNGIANPAAFEARYGVPLLGLTPTERLAMLTRTPLAHLPATDDADPAAWQQVCLIVDDVHESPAASTVGCGIGRATFRAARRIGLPVLPAEDLHAFAARFDAWARTQGDAAKRHAS